MRRLVSRMRAPILLESQGVYLGRGQFRTPEVIPQQPKQAIGHGVQDQPELVGQEAVATQAVGP